MMLENISAITAVSRTTISAVYRTAQIVASLPNLSYQNKARNDIYGLVISPIFIIELATLSFMDLL